MACALGFSGRGLFGRPGSYDSPFSCRSEINFPYQESPYGGYADQRHLNANIYVNPKLSFRGLGGPRFSDSGQYSQYSRPSGYANLEMGMGMRSGAGTGYSGTNFRFSQPPFAHLQSPLGLTHRSSFGRNHRSRFSHSLRGLASARGRYPSPRLLDNDDDFDDKDYDPFMQYSSPGQRQSLFGHGQWPTYGLQSMPRYQNIYDDYDGFDDDDDDDEYGDYISYPSWRR
ncbi:hypothetical protein T440DRAFT_152367 [Plenodomus tracheiphilus IPT5]|uniref:Uncharacterized protein n=1 Tax=Plenodomus tracheiphilus IPT5 TaxID=1408161 RepID=A0A6A7B023_9PLEO|nr:hypothetical protein T440DRAFT_152367 [Plenodomus tracheiphilus IPT5]